MKATLIVLLLGLCQLSIAQSRINLQGGWTASKIRALYEKGSVGSNPIGDSFTQLSFWHTPYMGIEYEYDYKRLRLSTGFVLMSMGSGDTPLFAGHPWVVAYWTIPILGGYHLNLDKGWDVLFEGGVELGLQNGKHIGGLHTPGTHWGNINLVAVVETEWKNFKLGVRGHLGVTNYRAFYNIIYKHTGITTYLGYTLWDHGKCKARRLKKLQEQNLE